jgi:hypothetical protein
VDEVVALVPVVDGGLDDGKDSLVLDRSQKGLLNLNLSLIRFEINLTTMF